MCTDCPDITGKPAADGFAFVPHSGAANTFLADTIACFGDRDLTIVDYVEVVRLARLEGFVVRDLLFVGC